MNKFNNFNSPKNRSLARKLRANGNKVIHFLRFGKDYALQTSEEMKQVADICEPSQSLVMMIPAYNLGRYVSKLISNDYKVIIG